MEAPLQLDEIPARLAELRKARRLSKSRLADLVGVHRSRVFQVENAESPIYLAFLAPAAVALGVRPSTILRGWPRGEPPDPLLREAPFDLVVFDHRVREQIRSERQRRELGAKTAAALTDVDQPWLIRIERGDYRRINLAFLARYCDGLEIDLVEQIVVPAEVSALEAGAKLVRDHGCLEGAARAGSSS